MSALNAVLRVLQDAGTPLHYREITRRILAANLWETEGKTPEAAVNARLAEDLKKNGSVSAFCRIGRGVFSINTGYTGVTPFLPGLLLAEETASLYMCRRLAEGERLSFTDAAERILEATSGKSLHYRDIARHALEHEMLDTSGKTPEATLYAQILAECRRRRMRGEQQRFMMPGEGMISLVKRQAGRLVFQAETANRKVRVEFLESIKKMSPDEFEDLIVRLLAGIGFEELEITGRTKIGCMDVRGTLGVDDVVRTHLTVQVKRWKQNVQLPVIQQARKSLGANEQGLIITTGDFSKGAEAEAARADAPTVGLMNGEQLVALLVENEIGVNITPLPLIQLGEQKGRPGVHE